MFVGSLEFARHSPIGYHQKLSKTSFLPYGGPIEVLEEKGGDWEKRAMAEIKLAKYG